MHSLNIVKTSEGTEKKEPILFKTLEKWITLAESTIGEEMWIKKNVLKRLNWEALERKSFG